MHRPRRCLRDAAEYLRLHDSPVEVAAAESSWWSRLGQAFAMGGPDSGYVPPSPESVYEGERFEIEERLMQEIVAEHTAVIVGHGAAQVLKGRAGVLSVFLHAPELWRVSARAAGLSPSGSSGPRSRWCATPTATAPGSSRRSAAMSWTDARGYDLTVDTGGDRLRGDRRPHRAGRERARVEGDETGALSA